MGLDFLDLVIGFVTLAIMVTISATFAYYAMLNMFCVVTGEQPPPPTKRAFWTRRGLLLFRLLVAVLSVIISAVSFAVIVYLTCGD